MESTFTSTATDCGSQFSLEDFPRTLSNPEEAYTAGFNCLLAIVMEVNPDSSITASANIIRKWERMRAVDPGCSKMGRATRYLYLNGLEVAYLAATRSMGVPSTTAKSIVKDILERRHHGLMRGKDCEATHAASHCTLSFDHAALAEIVDRHWREA